MADISTPLVKDTSPGPPEGVSSIENIVEKFYVIEEGIDYLIHSLCMHYVETWL